MRTRSTITRTAGILAGAAAVVALAASPAAAHVSIEETEQTAGAYTVLNFGVPHGCDGSATTKVEIQIPESILNVTPNRSPFYDVTVETEALSEPVEGPHGEEITEREAVVVYTATEPLPDGFRDALGISLQVPEDTAGETLYFPTVQTCEQGEIAWIQIPEDGQDPHDLDEPAPAITVVEGNGGHDSSAEDGDGEQAHGDESTGAESTDAETVAAEDRVDGELAASTSGDDGTDALTIVALIVGALGLVAGAAGFVTARKATR